MTEYRCRNPHPRIPNAPCNAVVRIWFSAGEVHLECWRCHLPMKFSFEKAGTDVDKRYVLA